MKQVIDLFSGCGGLSLGFSQAGFKVVLGVDNWQDSLETFKINHNGAKTENADLFNCKPEDIALKFGFKPGDIDVVVGGPPCQGFSISGKRLVDDPRNVLYKFFIGFLDYFRPKAFVMENVPNILSIDNGSVRNQILEDFKKIGYSVSYKILLASSFGVPQNRKRVFFVGLDNERKYEFPEETHGNNLPCPYITTSDALNDLPENSVVDGSPYTNKVSSGYQKTMRENSLGIYNHEIVVHNKETKRIISLVPDGGNYKDLPIELQQTRKVNIAWTRMNSNKPSFTIDTGHNHYFHYKYNRVPTARESARLQSFPDNFIFYGNKASQLKQIGNAVPPLLAVVVARKLLKYL